MKSHLRQGNTLIINMRVDDDHAFVDNDMEKTAVRSLRRSLRNGWRKKSENQVKNNYPYQSGVPQPPPPGVSRMMRSRGSTCRVMEGGKDRGG